jgi:hypothetical protein
MNHLLRDGNLHHDSVVHILDYICRWTTSRKKVLAICICVSLVPI